jgi:hypothetical protein
VEFGRTVLLLKRFFFVIETFATTQIVFLVPLLDFFDLNLPRGIDSWFSTELGQCIHTTGSVVYIDTCCFLFILISQKCDSVGAVSERAGVNLWCGKKAG